VVYHYLVGSRPLEGPEKIARFLDYHWGHTRDAEWKIETYAETGNKLLVEGYEKLFDTNTGKVTNTPYMGIFEFRDGRIARWRDYFQLSPDSMTAAAVSSSP
jgi:limonene-1,2-epoxide hydrolase